MTKADYHINQKRPSIAKSYDDLYMEIRRQEDEGAPLMRQPQGVIKEMLQRHESLHVNSLGVVTEIESETDLGRIKALPGNSYYFEVHQRSGLQFGSGGIHGQFSDVMRFIAGYAVFGPLDNSND